MRIFRNVLTQEVNNRSHARYAGEVPMHQAEPRLETADLGIGFGGVQSGFPPSDVPDHEIAMLRSPCAQGDIGLATC
jgi:hypothetical protein